MYEMDTFHQVKTKEVPLTHQQKFYCQLHQGGDSLYRMDSFVSLVCGNLDVNQLVNAMKALVARHDALRTRICLSDGMLLQVVDDARVTEKDKKRIYNIQGAESDQNARAKEFIAAAAVHGNDLVGYPMFDFSVLVFSSMRHMLVISLHHLFFDGRAWEIIYRDLWAFYAAFLRESPCAMPDAAQNSDYAVWQATAGRFDCATEIPSWKERFSGAVSLQWPAFVRARNSEPPTTSSALQPFGKELSSSLRELARTSRVLLSVEVLTAFAAVISLWCNQNKFVVTTTTVGRDVREYWDVVGYLSYPIHLLIKAEGRQLIGEFMRSVNLEYFRALAQRDHGAIVVSSPELMGRTLFQWFAPNTGIALPDSIKHQITVQPYHDPERVINFPKQIDIAFFFGENDEEVSGFALFRSDMFCTENVKKFLTDVVSVSELITSNPTQSVSTLLSNLGGRRGS